MSKVLRIVNDYGGLHATFKITSVSTDTQTDVPVSSARYLIEAIRQLPSSLFNVEVSYANINHGQSRPFHLPGDRIMNIANFVPDQDEDAVVRTELFVAPKPAIVPDDGVFKYFVVTNVYDVASADAHAVLLFDNTVLDVLGLLAANGKLFNLKLTVLAGVPDADYSVDFEKRSWNLDKASYTALIADIRATARTNEIIAASSVTAHDREKAQYTRKDGSVKEFEDFTLGGNSEEDE